MAAYSFKGLGWFGSGVAVALGCYLVTSTVAAERARVEAMNGAIVQAKKDLRGLETEFDTRANLAQLERYNSDALALQAPVAQQYVAGETALASLDTPLAPDGAPKALQAVIPAAPDVQSQPVPARVMTAAVQTLAPKPVVAAAKVETASINAPAAKAAPAAAALRGVRGQAMAMLDRKLLSDSTLSDLMRGERIEAARRH